MNKENLKWCDVEVEGLLSNYTILHLHHQVTTYLHPCFCARWLLRGHHIHSSASAFKQTAQEGCRKKKNDWERSTNVWRLVGAHQPSSVCKIFSIILRNPSFHRGQSHCFGCMRATANLEKLWGLMEHEHGWQIHIFWGRDEEIQAYYRFKYVELNSNTLRRWIWT